jgi:hypothetical protein
MARARNAAGLVSASTPTTRTVTGETFQKAVEIFRSAGNEAAIAIAHQLVETADDVPAGLVQQQQDFWNEIAAFDDLNDVPDAVWAIPEDIHDQMIAEIGRSTYAPSRSTAWPAVPRGRAGLAAMEDRRSMRCAGTPPSANSTS